MTELSSFRAASPLVQCLTNSVVMETTANVLLAAGATPAMVDTPAESAAFAEIASGVLINAGTPSAEKYEGMRQAVIGATRAGTPWVIDPVGAGGLSERSAFLAELVEKKPTAIRGNASEITALAGLGSGGRGVDALDSVDSAIPAAKQLAESTGGVVAISGAQDVIVSSGRLTRLTSGVPQLQKVIGTGCSLGALVAAYLGAGHLEPHDAVVAAHAHTGAAAQLAAKTSTLPGSFAVAWLDGLAQVDDEMVADLTTREEETW